MWLSFTSALWCVCACGFCIESIWDSLSSKLKGTMSILDINTIMWSKCMWNASHRGSYSQVKSNGWNDVNNVSYTREAKRKRKGERMRGDETKRISNQDSINKRKYFFYYLIHSSIMTFVSDFWSHSNNVYAVNFNCMAFLHGRLIHV